MIRFPPVCAVVLPLVAALLAGPALAQSTFGTDILPAPPQPGAVALATGGEVEDGEVWLMNAGRLNVRNVNRPTITVFRPVGVASPASVIIAPGGGFLGLAIDKEGWEVARWFANHGVTAFVLKYRTLPTPVDQAEFISEVEKLVRGEPSSLPPPGDTPPEALADGMAALRHVRQYAGEFGIDPHRVGFIGFSAGGRLGRSLIEKGGADRPDFSALIYPSMGPMVVPADAPPLFVAIAADDVQSGRSSLALVESYRQAGRSIEFHLFSAGGHGFALGAAGTPAAGWPDLMLNWMRTRGLNP